MDNLKTYHFENNLQYDVVETVGKRLETFRGWYSNGTKEFETHLVNNAKNGISKNWFSNGVLQAEANYCNDKLHGITSQWNESGSLLLQLEFKNGKKHGLSRIFNENGQIISEILYQKNIVKEIRFDS